jgi:hypothetical protein
LRAGARALLAQAVEAEPLLALPLMPRTLDFGGENPVVVCGFPHSSSFECGNTIFQKGHSGSPAQ